MAEYIEGCPLTEYWEGNALRLRERLQTLAEHIEIVGELSLRAAFVDVRVPPADVDETQTVPIAHEFCEIGAGEFHSKGVAMFW